jgi:hypothetical protein
MTCSTLYGGEGSASWPPYLQRKSPYQQINMGLGEPHNRSENFGKVKNCNHVGESKEDSSVVQPAA